MANKEVALFPIPGSVSFPYTQVPLHVFEPRYRTMVQYCLDHDLLMGVCHTQKVVHESKVNQTVEQALSSNQATYKPQDIFSIGEVELIETLPDGRMHIVVNMVERVRLVEELQTLPFLKVAVESWPDIEAQSMATAEQLKEKILVRLSKLFAKDEQLMAYLQQDAIQQMDCEQFSFLLFAIFRGEADDQQRILQMRSTIERLSFFLESINNIRP